MSPSFNVRGRQGVEGLFLAEQGSRKEHTGALSLERMVTLYSFKNNTPFPKGHAARVSVSIKTRMNEAEGHWSEAPTVSRNQDESGASRRPASYQQQHCWLVPGTTRGLFLGWHR